MAKALKPIVLVLLLLSIVSLILGVMLFGKREVLKASADQSRDAVIDIANNLMVTNFNAGSLTVEEAEGLPSMQRSLAVVVAEADNKVRVLENTQQQLEITIEERDQARDEASRAIADREAAEDEAARLTQQLADKTAEASRSLARVDQLTADKDSLQLDIDELNTQLATVEDELRDVQDQLYTLEQENSDLLAQLGYGASKQLPRGLTGRVLLVNRDWNFVVINLGSENGLVADAEMLIHRGDDLIGKVTISEVARNLAVADLQDMTLQDTVMEGDYVVY